MALLAHVMRTLKRQIWLIQPQIVTFPSSYDRDVANMWLMTGVMSFVCVDSVRLGTRKDQSMRCVDEEVNESKC